MRRVCEAREREATAKAERHKAAKERKVARMAEARAASAQRRAIGEAVRLGAPVVPWPAREREIHARFRSWGRLNAWEADLSGIELVLRRAGGNASIHCSGHCLAARRIVITVGLSLPFALKTLLHELAHAAEYLLSRRNAAARGRGKHTSHGLVWRGYFLSAAREVTGEPIAINGRTVHDFGPPIAAAIARMLAQAEA